MQRVHYRPGGAAARALLTVVALGAAATAAAGLRASPPQGVTLAGTWRVDTARSDDAQAIVDRARDDLLSRSGSARAGRRFDAFPGGGLAGGKAGAGGWNRADPPDNDAGELRGRSDGERPVDVGAGAAGVEGSARPGGVLEDLARNPEVLVFETAGQGLKVTAGESQIECEAGDKVTVGDRLGDAERQCGWDGRAWVIRTERPGSGIRTDRYEIARDGRSLTYTTVVTGGRLSKIKLSRVYRADPPAAPVQAPPGR